MTLPCFGLNAAPAQNGNWIKSSECQIFRYCRMLITIYAYSNSMRLAAISSSSPIFSIIVFWTQHTCMVHILPSRSAQSEFCARYAISFVRCPYDKSVNIMKNTGKRVWQSATMIQFPHCNFSCTHQNVDEPLDDRHVVDRLVDGSDMLKCNIKIVNRRTEWFLTSKLRILRGSNHLSLSTRC